MRSLRYVIVAVALLALSACDERDCVTERLVLTILERNELEITSRVEVRTVDAKEHPALADRASAMRLSLTLGSDVWTSRFALLRPRLETFHVDKQDQQISAIERKATVPRDELARFLADTSLSVNFFDAAEWSELIVTAGESRRASSKQKQQVAQAFDRAAAQYAGYAAAVADLYDYLDANPERAEIVWHAFLGFDEKKSDELSEDEGLLLEAIAESDPLDGMQTVDPQEALSLDATARLVYDPFPADITIELPGEVIEHDGFEKIGPKVVVVPRFGIADAMRSLTGRWLSPDPFGMMFSKELAGDQTPFDTVAIARQPRRASRPSAVEIRKALEESLRPISRYRVRWAATPR